MHVHVLHTPRTGFHLRTEESQSSKAVLEVFGSVHLLCSQAWRAEIRPPVLSFFNFSRLHELSLVHSHPANSGDVKVYFFRRSCSAWAHMAV